MKELWNNRYAKAGYAYGTEPNIFFKRSIDNFKPGKILLPGEGEGRNAVCAAKSGWEVKAVDFSESAKVKAFKLASEHNTSLEYEISNLTDFRASSSYFNCIGLIYVHLDPKTRNEFHNKLSDWLAPKGKIVLEAFSKNQIKYKSGGPKSQEMLLTLEELKKDFDSLNIELLEEVETNLFEGPFHSGKASVIRLIATKLQ